MRARLPIVTRADLWLPLLRRLTDAAPSWGVWKSPDSALEGDGDIDALGSEGDWDIVLDVYRSWAGERALGPVIACTHLPDLLVLAASEGTRLLQMDVYSRQAFRGPRFTSADALQPLMQLDERGFRRLRSGAEGLLLLLTAGVRRGGRPADTDTMTRIAQLLRADQKGVEETANAIGRRGSRALAAAQALAAGGWNRRALVLLEVSSAVRLLVNPQELTTCIVRDARRLRPCPLIKALEAGRRVPGDPARWFEEVSRSHRVYGTA